MLELTITEMALRAVGAFFIALILIRVAGRRSFGLHATFDNIIAFLLGAVLSRIVVGASPFVPTVIACFVIALLHRAFGLLAVYSKKFGKITKGEKILLFKEGSFIKKNLARAIVSEDDIKEIIRISTHKDSLEDIAEIYMERNGKISSLKKI